MAKFNRYLIKHFLHSKLKKILNHKENFLFFLNKHEHKHFLARLIFK